MIDLELLKKFSRASEGRSSIAQPFTQKGDTYSTDGHIAVRVFGLLDGVKEQETPNVEKIIADSIDITQQYVNLPDGCLTPKSERCEVCRGKGKNATCPDCDGDKSLNLYSDSHIEYNVDCRLCDETGVIEGECEQCDGEGLVFTFENYGTDIGSQLFNTKLLYKISKLPNVKIMQRTEESMYGVHFTFDGGDGIIMPMRRPI